MDDLISSEYFRIVALVLVITNVILMAVGMSEAVKAKNSNELNRPICFTYVEGEVIDNLRRTDRIFIALIIFF